MRLHPALFGASACFWLVAALSRLAPGVVDGLGDLPLAVPAAALAGLGAGMLSPGGHKPAEEILSTLLRLTLLLVFYTFLALVYLHPEPGAAHGAAALILLPALFLGHVLVMVPPGRALAPALDDFSGRGALIPLVTAVALNAVLFGLTLFWTHPVVLMAPAFLFLLGWSIRLRLSLRGLKLAVILSLVCVLLTAAAAWRLDWSYYHVLLDVPATTTAARAVAPPAKPGKGLEGWSGVIVDDSFIDFAVDLDPIRLEMEAASAPSQAAALMGMSDFYRLPFRLRPPGRALVINSGLGNVLAAGQREGWQALEALEPDPVLRRLAAGHPERPYQVPGLAIHREPALSFLRGHDGDYDLIVFSPALADRLFTRFSGRHRPQTLYTDEALRAASERLSTDGAVAVMFSAPVPYVERRLFRMMDERLGSARAWTWSNTAWNQKWTIIAAGPGCRRYRPRPGAGLVDRTDELSQAPKPPASTFNWPYLFSPTPRLYFLLLLVSIFFAGIAGGVLVPGSTFRAVHPPFALAGACLVCFVMAGPRLGLPPTATWALAAAILALGPLAGKPGALARRSGSMLAGFAVFATTGFMMPWVGAAWAGVAGVALLLAAIAATRLKHGQ